MTERSKTSTEQLPIEEINLAHNRFEYKKKIERKTSELRLSHS